jgi:hypothetical protein
MAKKKGMSNKKIKSLTKKKAAPKEASANPFERKINKQKFAIFGRKVKGTEQKIGQSRSLATDNVRPSAFFQISSSHLAKENASDRNATERKSKQIHRQSMGRARRIHFCGGKSAHSFPKRVTGKHPYIILAHCWQFLIILRNDTKKRTSSI